MLEKQVAYLQDVAKNDAGYVRQLQEVLEREKALPRRTAATSSRR
jgi:hypothetical protein